MAQGHDHSPADPETFDWNSVYTGDSRDCEAPDARLLARVSQLPAGRALDVGCGAGGLALALAERGWQTTGIDIANKAIHAARSAAEKRGLRADFSVADAASWQSEQRFDLVTCSFALPASVEDQQAVYAMMARALEPGGWVVIKDFDATMANTPSGAKFSAWHLLEIQELVAGFPGFEIESAEIVETPVHAHASGSARDERWTAAWFVARKPLVGE